MTCPLKSGPEFMLGFGSSKKANLGPLLSNKQQFSTTNHKGGRGELTEFIVVECCGKLLTINGF